MYAFGQNDKWQEQYVYEAFETELPAKQIRMAIEQLEAVGTDTDLLRDSWRGSSGLCSRLHSEGPAKRRTVSQIA